jgi:hypothetical protein
MVAAVAIDDPYAESMPTTTTSFEDMKRDQKARFLREYPPLELSDFNIPQRVTPCADGWWSTSTGSGTCSWHGGIAGG